MDRNLNANAGIKDQSNYVVKGRRTGKLTLKETSNNAVKTRINENVVVHNCVVVRAVNGNPKYMVDGRPVVTKSPKINKRSKEQQELLCNISNKPLASAGDKDGKSEDVRNEDGHRGAVQVS